MKILSKFFAIVLASFFFVTNSLCARESIALVTISTPNRISFSQYTLTSFRQYAEKWGYSFYFYQKPPATSYNIYWAKIRVMMDLLQEGKHDWYVWIDDDIFITNPDISLEQLIHDYGKQAHFIIGAHKTCPVLENDVNTGVFMVKNSEWSRNFLQQIWDIGEGKPKNYWEQTAVSELMITEKYKNSPYIARVPGRKIQSILTVLYKGDFNDYGQWEPGDFAAHLAGSEDVVRTCLFEQFAKNHNVYPALPQVLQDAFTLKQASSGTSFSDHEIYKINVYKADAETSLNLGKSAITYYLSGGRFGDNLVAYLHAKWISCKYGIPLLYCPFKYSDQLVLSNAELLQSSYSAKKVQLLGIDTVKINPNNGTLYVVPWFPESLQEYEPVDHGFFYFNVNWDDEKFISEVREFIRPQIRLNILQIPHDKITVAVHVRKNSNGFDAPASFEQGKQVSMGTRYLDDCYPLKCVNDTFYIDGIKKIRDLFKGRSLYVYIFTDDNCPQKIAEKYQQLLNDPSIIIDYRHDNNNHEINVLEDFFSMLAFDCLIRPDSNFSLVASKLGRYKVVISPAGYQVKNNHPEIVRTNVSMRVEDR